MGNFAGVVRGALAGLNDAAGNQQTAAALQARNQQDQQAKQAQLRAQILPHALAIKGLQTKLQALDPQKDAAEYAAITHDIARNLAEVRGIIYPEKDSKGNFFERGITDKLHLSSLKQREQKEKAAQAKGQAQDQSGAAAIAQGTVPTPNPYAQEKKQLSDIGFTPEQVQKALENKAGVTPKLTQDGSPYKGTDGKWYQNFRDAGGQITPREMPPNYTGPTANTADSKAREDFANDPDKTPGETFEQWKSRQTKAPSRDDKYIAILQKQQQGQPLTSEETAYSTAYKLWNKETKIDPGIARAAAFGASRYVPVIDPQDPENVTFMRAGDAAAAHAGSPAGIAFQTDKALTRAFTSGQPAQTINYFNTATEHLQQLQQAADALNNGDMQLFNKWGNAWATASGNPAPTNFATIRNAVAGELSKTFKGAAATDAEIDAINTSINSSQSPAQLSGAITNNIKLMGSKMDALRGQYEQGKKGQPNFPGGNPGKSTPPAKNSKGRVSVKKAMALPENKGKSEKMVRLDIIRQGFEPVP